MFQKVQWKTGKLGCLIVGALTFFAVTGAHAAAQALVPGGEPLSTISSDDYASSALNFLFRGKALPENFPMAVARLTPLASGLREAMGTYSLAMLALAAFLIFYQIVVMIAETAHHGKFMGLRGNQVWGPVRLIVAFLFLVPMGAGLSGGQHLVLKIASIGSNLASRAWAEVSNAAGTGFFSLASPRGPDLTSFTLASVEMELCRNIYQQGLQGLQGASQARLVGNIPDIQKIPSTNTTAETWRYSNLLNANAPMCGEYRFSGYRGQGVADPTAAGVVDHISDDIASFSHLNADAAIAQAKFIANSAAPSLSGIDLTGAMPVRDAVLALRQALQQQINGHLRTLATAQSSLAGKNMEALNKAGWISAGFLMPDLVRLQDSYGEMVEHILPDVQEPVFIHRLLTQQIMGDAISAEPALRDLDHDTVDGLFKFYANQAHANGRMHDWLYGSQSVNTGTMMVSGFDLRDQVTAATDASSAFDLFAQAIDAAALNRGVWGNQAGIVDNGSPLTSLGTLENYNPLAVLIEFGRRQFELGSYLFSLASSLITQSQLVMPSIMAGVLGTVFVLGGLGLIFLIPLLPFARFLLAALTWILELVEALIAMPLVAIAHISLHGDGVSGSAARQSYMLWVALALRPPLSVFGLVAGLLIFSFGISIMLIALMPFAQLASVANGGTLIIANTGLVISYDIVAYVIANIAFKGITLFPDRALRWISPFVMTESPALAINEGATLAGPTLSAAISAFIHRSSQQSAPGERQGGRGTNRGTAPAATAMTNLLPSYQKAAYGEPPPTVGDKAKPGSGGRTTVVMSQSAAAASATAIVVEKDKMIVSTAKSEKRTEQAEHLGKPFFPEPTEAKRRPPPKTTNPSRKRKQKSQKTTRKTGSSITNCKTMKANHDNLSWLASRIRIIIQEGEPVRPWS